MLSGNVGDRLRACYTRRFRSLDESKVYLRALNAGLPYTLRFNLYQNSKVSIFIQYGFWHSR
jgi:hypothetical protein